MTRLKLLYDSSAEMVVPNSREITSPSKHIIYPVFSIPALQLHSSIFFQVFVHIEGLVQHARSLSVVSLNEGVDHLLRLMSPSFLQALEFSPVKVILQYGSVLGMRAFFDDDSCSFAG